MPEATNPLNQGAMDGDTERAANTPSAEEADSANVGHAELAMFAAVMALMLAGIHAMWAIVQLLDVAWIAGTAYGTFGGYLWVWALLDILIAGVSLYAGYDIIRGGRVGFLYGVIVASISAVRWFFYIPVVPVLAIAVIVVDIFIIYGLVTSVDYFRARATA